MKVTAIALIVILGLAATAFAVEDEGIEALELGKYNSIYSPSVLFIMSIMLTC